jgi:hypothetical protein
MQPDAGGVAGTVERTAGSALTAPVIYSLLLPILLLDLWASLYQQICFRVYGIARVRRSDYLVIDRDLLPYLDPVDKLNCAFCGYANGVIAYVREIASRTEQYWCPIKHAHAPASVHRRYRRFAPYGDARAYRRRAAALRAQLRARAGPVT